jgi:hypothetical protein
MILVRPRNPSSNNRSKLLIYNSGERISPTPLKYSDENHIQRNHEAAIPNMSNLIRVNNRVVEEQKASEEREEEIIDIDQQSSIECRPGIINEFSDPLRQSIIAY